MGHIHPVWNDDPLFLIDPDSRTITKESSTGKNQLMQYDHNSEVFRFKIPVAIEGHQVDNCDIRQIHYINSGTGTSVSNRESNVGIYEIQDLTSDIDGSDYLYFDWLVSQNATQLVGDLKFQIKFGCTNPDRPGEIDYMWGSQVYSAVEILPGINNAEIVVTEYTDILTQWKAEIDRSLDEMNEKIDNLPGGSGEPSGDLSEYVKKTDYATDDTGGVVKVKNYSSGLSIGAKTGELQVYPAETTDIDTKASFTKPVGVSNFDYAVSKGTHQDMSDDYDVTTLKTTNKLSGTQGQLPASYNAVKGYIDDKIGDISTALDELHNYAQALIGGES